MVTKRILYAILIGFALAALCFLVVFLFWMYRWHIADPLIERQIKAKFDRELKPLSSQIKVNSFHLWEGDSIDEITIKGKGKVRMWYNLNGISIDRIGKYGTDFPCGEEHASVGMSTGLTIEKDAPLGHFFSFEVKSLHDLVTHYDDITRVLATFPKRRQDGMNTKFTFKLPNTFQSITCYVFVGEAEY